MQVHGHLQLVGWMGLLIMGVSARLLPPLFSRPIPKGATLLAVLVSFGLLFRSSAQILLPHLGVPELRVLFRGIFTLGSITESAGFFLYAGIVSAIILKRFSSLFTDRAVRRLLPYLICMTLGSILIAALNTYGAVDAFLNASDIVAPTLSFVIADLFLYLLILPATLLFSVKLLPLFLGLREPRWPVGAFGTCYFLLAAAIAIFRIAALFGVSVPDIVERLTFAALGTTLIAFISSLDILTRRHLPERLMPLIKNDALRGRGLLPDRGEYGNFEWHLYAAYSWLLLAAVLLVLQPFRITISADTIRHMLLLGFGTNLIFGVGYRLLPGLLSMRLARPAIVAPIAIMLNVAALARILPRVLPGLFEINANNFVMKWSFGLSGSMALIAVLLFGLNLGFGWLFNRTHKRKSEVLASL